MSVSTPERSRSRPRRGREETPESPGGLRPRPARRRWNGRSRAAAVVLAAAGTAVLAAAGIFGLRFLSQEVFGPQAQVEAYLAALASGDGAAATAMLPPSEALTPQDPGIYASAGNRITSYEILGQEIKGSEAVVRFELEQNGQRSASEFVLHANGRRALAFTAWQLPHTAARTVAVTVPSGTEGLRVNGIGIPLAKDSGTVELRLLPGGYRLEGPDSPYLGYGAPHTVLVEPGMAGDPAPVRLSASVTAELAAEVQAQGEAYLQECLGRDEAAPAACPNEAYASGEAARYRGAGWELEKAPVYRIVGTPATDLAVYATGGKARVTYQEDVTGSGRWETRSDLVNIAFGSDVEVAGDALKLDFRP